MVQNLPIFFLKFLFFSLIIPKVMLTAPIFLQIMLIIFTHYIKYRLWVDYFLRVRGRSIKVKDCAT